MVARPIKIAKEVNVLHVEPKAVQKYWSLVEFMLKEGLKYDGYPMSIGHLKDTILKGENQLFMMFGSDDGESYKVFGVFVTRVTQLPNYKQAEVILLRGVKRDLWQKEAAEMIDKKKQNLPVNLDELNSTIFPAYTTAAGWLGYSDDKMKALIKNLRENNIILKEFKI